MALEKRLTPFQLSTVGRKYCQFSVHYKIQILYKQPKGYISSWILWPIKGHLSHSSKLCAMHSIKVVLILLIQLQYVMVQKLSPFAVSRIYTTTTRVSGE